MKAVFLRGWDGVVASVGRAAVLHLLQLIGAEPQENGR